jgi:squalene-hopene/tetraprenyl-beta-curcumene cyclase
MSLAASGQANHIVTQRGFQFLLQSQRSDGSWPIDTNLSTWCTTLAIDALPQSSILNPQSSIEWLLRQQYKTEHPYTHAAPGGWAWTDLPGGVPDADDTAGALLALSKIRNPERGVRSEEITRAAEAGIHWLLDLQNRDGGIPTFCRGWGALPFDRSSADITAHVIRAWRAWSGRIDSGTEQRMARAERRAVRFLLDVQNDEGAWGPLWFGNQHTPDEVNYVYGTCRVLTALVPPDPESPELSAVVRACQWLLGAQKADGGWGGSAVGSSIEETALAVQALSAFAKGDFGSLPREFIGAEVRQMLAGLAPAWQRGTDWLVSRVESGAWLEPAPIGFYFAKLWYFERLYPLIFTVGALSEVAASIKASASTTQ